MKDGEIQCSKCYRLTSRRTLSVDLSRSNLNFTPDARLTSEFLLSVFVDSNRRHIDGGDTIPKRTNIFEELSHVVESNTIDTKISEAVNGAENNMSVSEEKDTLLLDQKLGGRPPSHFTTRKSNRIKPAKTKPQNNAKTLATKGRGRRIIFKRNVSLYFFSYNQ